jgi:hypothetical protein
MTEAQPASQGFIANFMNQPSSPLHVNLLIARGASHRVITAKVQHDLKQDESPVTADKATEGSPGRDRKALSASREWEKNLGVSTPCTPPSGRGDD